MKFSRHLNVDITIDYIYSFLLTHNPPALYVPDFYRLKQLKELFIFIILFINVFSGRKNPAEVDNKTLFSQEVESVLRYIADLLIADNSNLLIKHIQV